MPVHPAPVLAGRLYLIAPGKLHPLWYSPFMPMFFFVSSMAAGCSMVIFEGMWAHKGVHHYMDETHLREADEVVFSFSKAGAFILFGYFMLKLIDMLVQANLPYLCTGYGLWWLVEMLFFVLTPLCCMPRALATATSSSAASLPPTPCWVSS